MHQYPKIPNPGYYYYFKKYFILKYFKLVNMEKIILFIKKKQNLRFWFIISNFNFKLESLGIHS